MNQSAPPLIQARNDKGPKITYQDGAKQMVWRVMGEVESIGSCYLLDGGCEAEGGVTND